MMTRSHFEEWRDVPSYPGMKASSWGRVLMPETTVNGRLYKTRPVDGVVTRATKHAVHVYRGIYSRRFGNIKVHRAVCEAFHGQPPDRKLVVIHIDENALNNAPSNLKWGTQKENLGSDAVRRRLMLRATKIGAVAADAIRAKYAAGAKQSEIAAEYGVSHQTIFGVVNKLRKLDITPEWR